MILPHGGCTQINGYSRFQEVKFKLRHYQKIRCIDLATTGNYRPGLHR
jgi:hypothetical protein